MIIQCKCDCGTEFEEFDKWGRRRRFVKGHQNKGKTFSDEHRRNMSINHADVSGENHPMFGKKHSPETRQLMSKNHAHISGEDHYLYGKHPSDATRQLISKNHARLSGEKHPMYGKTTSGMRGKIHSPETRQLISEANSGENNPFFGKIHSDKTKQLISKNHPDVSGENNPNWQGGVSKLPYCLIWTPWLKNEIKERDNHQCQNPDCSHKFEKLFVHHIDYDKKNCSVDNLITLCNSCNAKANFNRDYWKEFYNGLSKTKSMVI